MRQVGIFAGIGWAVLLLRYFAGGNFASLASTLRYFSYFTVLSNILATLTLTEAALRSRGARLYLNRPAVTAATTLYMAITGLSTLPPPVGMMDHGLLLCDSLLHYFMPIVFFIFWIGEVGKGKLSFWHIPIWLAFPVVYGIFLYVHGSFYVAFDVQRLGMAQVTRNAVLMLISFSALAMSLVVIDHVLGRQAPAEGKAMPG